MMEEEAASKNRTYGGQGGKSARGLISKDRKPSHRDGQEERESSNPRHDNNSTKNEGASLFHKA
jgi:hypothetical protein